jgi:hypothetical protein
MAHRSMGGNRTRKKLNPVPAPGSGSPPAGETAQHPIKPNYGSIKINCKQTTRHDLSGNAPNDHLGAAIPNRDLFSRRDSTTQR